MGLEFRESANMLNAKTTARSRQAWSSMLSLVSGLLKQSLCVLPGDFPAVV